VPSTPDSEFGNRDCQVELDLTQQPVKLPVGTQTTLKVKSWMPLRRTFTGRATDRG
jgi:hypothetical protein